MPSSIIQEFIVALEQEIEALKRGKGGSVVKIFNGRFLREVAGQFIYVFNLENFLAVLDDSPAEIRIGGNSYLRTAQRVGMKELEGWPNNWELVSSDGPISGSLLDTFSEMENTVSNLV
jgi:hypothetical protein